jgi:hypothetical protein
MSIDWEASSDSFMLRTSISSVQAADVYLKPARCIVQKQLDTRTLRRPASLEVGEKLCKVAMVLGCSNMHAADAMQKLTMLAGLKAGAKPFLQGHQQTRFLGWPSTRSRTGPLTVSSTFQVAREGEAKPEEPPPVIRHPAY